MENHSAVTLTDVINYSDFAMSFGAFLDRFKSSASKSEMISAPPNPLIIKGIHIEGTPHEFAIRNLF